MALKRLGYEYEIVGISEINQPAIKAYYSLHGGNIPNYGDISKINPLSLPDFNFFTYSFPCQDIAPQGKMEGLIKGKTRSGLLYECEKIIEAKRPKYLLMENVKNLVNRNFKPYFEDWLTYLNNLGYNNYWYILNAADFNIPQSRQRVFCISILNEEKEITIKTSPLTTTIFDFLDNNENYIEETPFDCKNGVGAFRGRKNEAGKYIQKLEMRKDNCCNTLTTVAKDNVIVINNKYRYLTGKECLRLMGLTNEEIEQICKVTTDS